MHHVDNPHQNEYHQENIISSLYLDGNDIPSFTNYLHFLRNHPELDGKIFSFIYRILRDVRSIIFQYRPHQPSHMMYRDLRIRFLTGEINMERFHHLLGWREKKRLKAESTLSLIQFIAAHLMDIIRRSILQRMDMRDLSMVISLIKKRIDLLQRVYDLPYIFHKIASRLTTLIDQSSS
jgi:hypothetical protein